MNDADREVSLLTSYLYQEDLYGPVDDDGVDLITLRYTLLQCRKQLLAAMHSLFDTEHAYGKVELREDFDKLYAAHERLKFEYNTLTTRLVHLLDHCQSLVRQSNELLVERNEYHAEWERVKDVLTPRPDWNKCARLVVEWKQLSNGRTSDDLVEVVLNEILHGNTVENIKEYLPVVSGYEKNGQSLEQQELIVNRRLRRRPTGLLIKDIWTSTLSDENKFQLKLTDYVFGYLTKRFDSQRTAVEISSNLQDACTRYRHHYEINLFWQILTGQMEEKIYHDEMKEYGRILQHFIQVAVKTSPSLSSWVLPWSALPTVLNDLYPNWSSLRISLLVHSAQMNVQLPLSTSDDLEFWLLFMEDDEGRLGEFLVTVRQLLQQDKAEYIGQVRDLLIGHPLVTVGRFKQVVRNIDPDIPRDELQRYVDWVFGLQKVSVTRNRTDEVPREVRSRDFEEVLLRLERCSCFMH